MKQETTSQKQIRGKPLTDPKLVIWLRDRLYTLLTLLAKTKVRYKVEAVNSCRPLPGKPIIFAVNHSAFQDTPIMLRATGRRSYIFAGKQRLAFADWLFFALNGTVWVDRKSREDTAACKAALVAYLAKGQSVLRFPEGTWNLTPNRLMLPMKWGIVEVAQKAGAQIIPAVLDYDRGENVCRVRFGAPMAGDALRDKAQAIRALRDAMATLRWDFIGSHKPLHRGSLNTEQLRREMYRVLDEYPPLDWEYERTCIYKPYPSPEEVFSHLDKLIPCRQNAFLFRRRDGIH